MVLVIQVFLGGIDSIFFELFFIFSFYDKLNNNLGVKLPGIPESPGGPAGPLSPGGPECPWSPWVKF